MQTKTLLIRQDQDLLGLLVQDVHGWQYRPEPPPATPPRHHRTPEAALPLAVRQRMTLIESVA